MKKALALLLIPLLGLMVFGSTTALGITDPKNPFVNTQDEWDNWDTHFSKNIANDMKGAWYYRFDGYSEHSKGWTNTAGHNNGSWSEFEDLYPNWAVKMLTQLSTLVNHLK